MNAIAADAVSYQLSYGGVFVEYTDTSPEQLPTKLSRTISAWEKLIKQQIKSQRIGDKRSAIAATQLAQ